jgi:hypothetical protein
MATLDPTKGLFPPDNTGGLLKQVDDSATADNIFIFADGTRRFKWTANQKGEYPLSQAKILSGDTADKTSLLQTVLSHPDIKTIELDAQQTITINGTLVCGGKKIVFTSGAKFTGTGVIDNAVIDADYSDQIFDTTISLTNCRLTDTRFSVKWFGATGSGSIDDQPAIQKAIDTIVKNPTLGKDLYFPKGNYRINAPIIVYDWDGDLNNYRFTSVNLIGGIASHFTNTLSEAIITANFTNTFAIGIQRCRSLVIQGLVIQGAFDPVWGSRPATDYYEGDYDTWARQWGVRDEPHSPYAGIVIDPFRMDGDLPEDVYPGMEAWYRGSTRGGSSGIMVKECRITGFTVGIILGPSGFTNNAENIRVEDVTIETCKVAFASTQRQEKNNSIKGLISWNGVHTILDTSSYGQRRGCPPNIDGMNIAGNTIRLFNITWLQFNVTFKNIYAEVLYNIGNLKGGIGMISMEGCDLDFNGVLPLVPTVHCNATTVKFDNCKLRYYDDLFNKRLCFSGDNNLFVNCSFDKLPYFIDQIETQKASNSYINCKTEYEVIGVNYFKGSPNIRTVGMIPTVPMKIEWARKQNNYILDWYLDIKGGCPDKYVFVDITDSALTLNESTRIGTITSPHWFCFSLNDYLLAFNQTTTKYISLGRVTGINTTTGEITLSEVPQGVNDAHQFFGGYLPKIKKVHSAFVCSATQNGTALTNVDYDNWGGYYNDIVGEYMETLENTMADFTNLVGGSTFVYGDNIYVPNYGVENDGNCTEYIIATVSPDIYALDYPAFTGLMKSNTVWVERPRGANTTSKVYKFTTAGYLNAAGAGKTRQAVWSLV